MYSENEMICEEKQTRVVSVIVMKHIFCWFLYSSVIENFTKCWLDDVELSESSVFANRSLSQMDTADLPMNIE